MIKANRRRGLDHGPSSSTAINQTSAQHGMHERPWHEAGGYCGAASRRVLKVLRTICRCPQYRRPSHPAQAHQYEWRLNKKSELGRRWRSQFRSIRERSFSSFSQELPNLCSETSLFRRSTRPASMFAHARSASLSLFWFWSGQPNEVLGRVPRIDQRLTWAPFLTAATPANRHFH